MTSENENTSQLRTRPVDRFADMDTFTVPPVKVGDKMVTKFQYETYYDCELFRVYYYSLLFYAILIVIFRK